MTSGRAGRCLAVLGLLIGGVGCADSRDVANQSFDPMQPGILTVATSLPAPGFWEGTSVDNLTGGFEHGIAVALAERFDLELLVVDVPFDRLISGDLGAADLALAQITITEERQEQLAFSVPYYVDDAGAVVPPDTELTDLETAREQRWVVQPGTVEAEALADDVEPDEDPTPCDDAVACVEAVAGGRAEATLVDLSTALILTDGRDDLTVGGRIVLDGEIAAALPAESDEVEVVDAALRSLEADGTLADLAGAYLAPVFAGEPDSIRVIRTPS